jgi:uncharacterized protein
MSPDDPADAQRALAAYIRDPARAPAPAGIEPRRLQVYRDLFFSNIDSMLAGSFPVIRRILDGERWQVLVREFFRDHSASTPLFTELAREFVRYLETRVDADHGTGDPPWLAALAHYEWVELALQISELRVDAVPHDPEGDLLDGRPLVSPLAWPLEYPWPVQRIGPDYQPDAPPDAPTWLLLQRDAAGDVRFQQLSALTFRLLQRLDQQPDLDGLAQLQALAIEAAAPSVEAFVAQGTAMLQQLRRDGTICGTRVG